MNLKDKFTDVEIELARQYYTWGDAEMTKIRKEEQDFVGVSLPWEQISDQRKVAFCLGSRFFMGRGAL